VDLTEKKIRDGSQSGADYLCSACPYCHIQFDMVQKSILSERGGDHRLPSVLYPQLLGLAMGVDREILGLEMNRVPEGFLSNERSAVSNQLSEEAVSDQPPEESEETTVG
jgi:heterodisulfide reductase subunit B